MRVPELGHTAAPVASHANIAHIESCLAPDVLSRAIPELRSGAWRLLSCTVTKVQKLLGKRIVFGRLVFEDQADKRIRAEEIVAKVYGSDRGARSLAALRQLWKAGFRPPAGCRVPQPYGYSSEEGTLLQAVAPGTTWADSLRGDRETAASASSRAAIWLICLQRSLVAPGVAGWERDNALMRRLVTELAAAFPRLAPRLEAVDARLSQFLRAEGVPLVPSHGDYHPQNVFLTAATTTVIDFDTFALREAGSDVGYGIGQLLIMSRIKMGDFAPGAAAALAFWRRYHLEGQAPWRRVAGYVARSFLQSLHYELCVLRNNRLELVDPWLDLMEEWLESDRQATLERLITVPTAYPFAIAGEPGGVTGLLAESALMREHAA